MLTTCVTVASKILKNIEIHEVKSDIIDELDKAMWEDAPPVPGVANTHAMSFVLNKIDHAGCTK